MLVKFFTHGRGDQGSKPASGKSATRYLLGNLSHDGTQRSVEPELLRGDPNIFEEIVGHGRHAGRYTSGVLRFTEEEAVDEVLQQELMTEFEQALLPGLDPDQYSSVWVRHEDKGGVELHFLVAGEELRTGKRLNAYYHAADMQRINAWKDSTVYERQLVDPSHPSRARARAYGAHKTPSTVREIKSALDDHIEALIADGEIRDRLGVLEELKNLNLEVSRVTKKSVSIKSPLDGASRPIRLSSLYYQESFRASDLSPEAIGRKVEGYDASHDERGRASRGKYLALYSKRARENREIYKISERAKSGVFEKSEKGNDAVYRKRDEEIVERNFSVDEDFTYIAEVNNEAESLHSDDNDIDNVGNNSSTGDFNWRATDGLQHRQKVPESHGIRDVQEDRERSGQLDMPAIPIKSHERIANNEQSYRKSNDERDEGLFGAIYERVRRVGERFKEFVRRKHRASFEGQVNFRGKDAGFIGGISENERGELLSKEGIKRFGGIVQGESRFTEKYAQELRSHFESDYRAGDRAPEVVPTEPEYSGDEFEL